MRLMLAIILAATPLIVSAAPAGNPVSGPVAARLGAARCADALRMADRAPGIIGDGMRTDARFDLHLGLHRTVDRCPVPAILRRDVDRRAPARPAR